jgi:signal transduction histidine kinase
MGERLSSIRIIREFSESLGRTRTNSDAAWTICRNAAQPLGLEDCVVYLVDDCGGRLLQAAALGPKNPFGTKILRPIVLELGQGIVGNAASSGETQCIPDTTRDERYVLDDQLRLSELAVPIVHGDEVLGVIDSEHSQKNFFDDSLREVLSTVASISAVNLAAERTRKDNQRIQAELSPLVEQHDRPNDGTPGFASWAKALANGDLEFLRNLSHELRTPLGVILGYTEILQRSVGSARGTDREFLESIDRSGHQLLDVVENLLAIPQLSGASASEERQPVDLVELIDDVVRGQRRRYGNRAPEVGVLDLGDASIIDTHPEKLSQALSHLVENAMKFGGGHPVEIRVVQDPDSGRPGGIDVLDRGLGIEQQHLERIFEPLYRVRGKHTQATGGLGLGLSICRSLCRELGYSLTVESEFRVGSVFHLTFSPTTTID